MSTIKSKGKSGSALASVNEEMIKAGLRNYFLSNTDVFERGIKIYKIEKEVARGHRPDFIGTDFGGKPVIIECKGIATAQSCYQHIRYAKRYGRRRRSPRLMLIAFRFEDECRKVARKARINLFECYLRSVRAL